MTKVIIAYCGENQYAATKIASALSGKTDIEKVVFDAINGMDTLKRAAAGNAMPVLLLISDNLLKSERAMNDALQTIQSLGASQRLIAVTTDGVYGQGNQPSRIPTSFDRVSSVIQYMNHWQDCYLELRRVKPTGLDEATYAEKVRVVRAISSEIGELLRYLRSTEYFSFDQFEDSNYIILYRVLNLNVPADLETTRRVDIHHTVMPTEKAEYVVPKKASDSTQNGSYTEGVAVKNEDVRMNTYAPIFKEIEHQTDNQTGQDMTSLDYETIPGVAPLSDHSVHFSTGKTVENGFEKMVEKPIEHAVHQMENRVEVLENQYVIPEAVEKNAPMTLESILDDMRGQAEKPFVFGETTTHAPLDDARDLSHLTSQMADKIPPKIEAKSALIAASKTQITPDARPIGTFTIEQILKDEELMALVENGNETPIIEAVKTEVYEGKQTTQYISTEHAAQHELGADEDEIIRKIAAEAAEDTTQNEEHLAANAAHIAHVADYFSTNQNGNGHAHATGKLADNFVEKTDAEFHEVIDEDAIKNEVSRIFGEAEQPAAHFEFEKEDVEMIEPIESQHVTEDEKELYLLHRSSNLSDALLGNEKSHVENGQYTEGSKQPTELEKLRQAVADAPEDNAVRYRFAAELAQQNHVAQATEQLETILDYDRTNVDAYVLLAYLAEQQGDYMLSLNSLEKVALLKPDYTGIYYKLGRLTNEHFKRQNRKAYRYFQDAVAQDPTNADARYRFGVMSLEQNGDFKAAIAHFEAAAEAAPNHEGVVFELAKAHFEIGNRAEAARWYARATALNDKFKTESNDLLFHYKEPKPEPEPQPNDNGTTVLITGATSGIGRATAELFAKNGFRTILTGRRADRLEDLKTHFETEYRNRVQLLNFDVRSLADVKNALETLEDDFKNVDILINNAGLASGMAPIHEGDIEDWERMIDTNIKGLLYMTRAIAPHMVARRKGHIINLSSIAGKEIYPNGNVYCASKHAVDALTRAMRVDLHKYNIRVSQVTPGAVEETEFAIVRFHGDAERAKIYEDFTPLKASDVAETIYFIVTRPEYVNLQDITMMSTQQASANHFDRSGRMVNG